MILACSIIPKITAPIFIAHHPPLSITQPHGASIIRSNLQVLVILNSAAYIYTQARNNTYSLYDYPGDEVGGRTTLTMSYLMTKAGTTNDVYGIYDATTFELYRLAFISFAGGGGDVQYKISHGTIQTTRQQHHGEVSHGPEHPGEVGYHLG